MSNSERASEQLTDSQLARIAEYGAAERIAPGDVIFGPGDVDYDLFVIESGQIEIVTPTIGEELEAVVARYGPRGFLGELNFLTGQTAHLLARATDAGCVYRITRQRFRELMATEPELSDIVLRTLLARRDMLRTGAAARSLTILGSEPSVESVSLRIFVDRQRLPHRWIDAESLTGGSLLASMGLSPADLPVVITPQDQLARATPGAVSEILGLLWDEPPDR